MKEKDDKILLAQVSDKIEMCENKNKIEYTNFLDLAQIELVQNYIDKLKIENYISYGGYEQSERKLFVIYPEKFNSTVVEKNLVSIVKIVRIQLPDELKGKYAHRDYLGAVIKLGVKREKIGDIIVADDGADILVKPDVLKFLLQNLPELKRFSKSEIKQIEIENLRKPNIQKEEITIIVPSLRLDSIVAELANASRNKATTFITSERVLVNYMVETKTSKEIKIEDTITIRGKGRFVVKKQTGTSKKGKQIIKIEKFK